MSIRKQTLANIWLTENGTDSTAPISNWGNQVVTASTDRADAGKNEWIGPHTVRSSVAEWRKYPADLASQAGPGLPCGNVAILI
jgi:hypothetical protein